ncbi:MAG: hypothetical protein KDA60_20175 [Planctomycetales bacterium]|nr:hypothetical protein [Planctomycetales bacterium]
MGPTPPPTLLIRLSDHRGGGPIVTDLEAFLVFADRLEHELAELEMRWLPQAAPASLAREAWSAARR